MAAQRKPKSAVAPKQSAPSPKKSVPASSPAPEPTDLQILKQGRAPTVSGRSMLGYSVGCDASKALYLQLTSNSAAGMFTKCWVPLAEIRKALGAGGPITAVRLATITRGRSANDSAFILAVIKAEGLIQAAKGKQRVHELAGDWDDWAAMILDPSRKQPTAPKTAGKAKTSAKTKAR